MGVRTAPGGVVTAGAAPLFDGTGEADMASPLSSLSLPYFVMDNL